LPSGKTAATREIRPEFAIFLESVWIRKIRDRPYHRKRPVETTPWVSFRRAMSNATLHSKVAVGLSGGVDSSTTAVLLKEQGFEVLGVTLWLMRGKGQCCSEGMVDAAQLCEKLGITHHVVDIRDTFESYIIDYLVDGYQSGTTPLPCSQCNKAVKFGPMLRYAREELGADRIATGHYARTAYDPDQGRYQLLRALDRNKDQSYFLYDLDQDVLGAVLFPLGEYDKAQTREFARKFGLHVADKPESQDLCLIEAHGSMQAFLDKYITPKAGEIVDLDGKVLGQHEGIHHYTIGQRKGIGVSAPEPLYVVALDAVRNRVVVATRDRATRPSCTVSRVNWVSIAPPSTPIHAEVQIRYRSPAVPVTIVPLEGSDRVKLVFDEPQFSVTPGQAAVWYRGEVLLGGGIIDRFEDAAS
jgi:tRNA-specific 2-thiouridylase